MRRRLFTKFFLFALLALCAPLRAQTSQPTDTHSIWLLHLPGIGGLLFPDRAMTQGLLDGGLDASIHIYDWTGAERGLVALVQVQLHDEQSTIVAHMIERQIKARPDQRLILTAHSAGTGVAVWALEKLPDGVMIDDLVLIASALSPGYDLTAALRHVRHRAVAFNSNFDVLVLGTGTRTFGTVDRVNTDAAGRVGFSIPANASAAEQYKKFEQIPYDADWMRFDNNGEHIGPMMQPFAENVIARVLMGKGLPARATTRKGE